MRSSLSALNDFNKLNVVFERPVGESAIAYGSGGYMFQP
jgi:hypothetical protein